MRKRILLPLFLALSCVLWLGGCGTGDGGGTRLGASTFGLAFVPSVAGETMVIGFKNAATSAAPVFVSAYREDGTTYGLPNQPFVVPARGELRVPLGQIAGGATSGGWVCVETRDVNNLDAVTGEPTPLPTSGSVHAYAHRQSLAAGTEEDATPGVTARTSGVSLTVTPDTDRIQLLSYTFDQNAAGAVPQAVLYAISTFGADGAQVGPSATQFVPASGAFTWVPTVSTGHVRVEPVGAPFPAVRQIRYALVAQENGFQSHVESRYTEASINHWSGLLDLGFELSFGSDDAGNVHDFALVLSNPTGRTESLTLQAVYRKGGAPVLTVPRGYVLGAGRTVYMRTTTRDSFGLRQGEDSWFADLFGDVFASTGFDEVTVYVQAPRSIDVSARHYDPSFNAFYRVLRSIPRTTRACIFDLPIQVTTAGGKRNYISITNTTNGNLEVPIRAFTPALGTEYILDSITVPALSRFDWSPDGMVFREEPTDTAGPPVPFLRFDMVPLTGALFRSRTELRDSNGLLFFVTPTLTRD